MRAGSKPKQTTRGWGLLVEWRDGTSTWVDLKYVKEANPIELAVYAVANKIEKQPDFALWVPYVLKKHERIIGKARSKFTSWLMNATMCGGCGQSAKLPPLHHPRHQPWHS